jgi:hypothetical protein
LPIVRGNQVLLIDFAGTFVESKSIKDFMKSKDARANLEKLDYKIYQPGRTDGVWKYSILEDGIVLVFHQSKDTYYVYDYLKPGRPYVRTMIKKAEAQEGLNTYVTQKVKDNYSAKAILNFVE